MNSTKAKELLALEIAGLTGVEAVEDDPTLSQELADVEESILSFSHVAKIRYGGVEFELWEVTQDSFPDSGLFVIYGEGKQQPIEGGFFPRNHAKMQLHDLLEAETYAEYNPATFNQTLNNLIGSGVVEKVA